MIVKILRTMRQPVLFNVFRRCAHDSANRSNADRDEGRIGQIADTNGNVQALIHQVDDPIDKQGPSLHHWIAVQEIAQDRGHEHAPEQDRPGDMQFAARRRVRSYRRFLRFLQFL